MAASGLPIHLLAPARNDCNGKTQRDTISCTECYKARARMQRACMHAVPGGLFMSVLKAVTISASLSAGPVSCSLCATAQHSTPLHVPQSCATLRSCKHCLKLGCGEGLGNGGQLGHGRLSLAPHSRPHQKYMLRSASSGNLSTSARWPGICMCQAKHAHMCGAEGVRVLGIYRSLALCSQRRVGRLGAETRKTRPCTQPMRNARMKKG